MFPWDICLSKRFGTRTRGSALRSCQLNKNLDFFEVRFFEVRRPKSTIIDQNPLPTQIELITIITYRRPWSMLSTIIVQHRPHRHHWPSPTTLIDHYRPLLPIIDNSDHYWPYIILYLPLSIIGPLLLSTTIDQYRPTMSTTTDQPVRQLSSIDHCQST